MPPGAGVGSAIGFLRAPFGYEAVRSAVHRLSAYDAATVGDLFAAMREEALGFVTEGLAGRVPIVGVTLFMRYVGQGWDIPVEVPGAITDEDAASLAGRYEAAYERFFGRPIEGLDIEIVSWSVKASSPLPPVDRVEAVESRRIVPPPSTRAVFDAGQRGFVPTGIYDRTALAVGDTVEGPAIIAERETSTVVTAAFTATVQPDGCLFVSRRAESRP